MLRKSALILLAVLCSLGIGLFALLATGTLDKATIEARLLALDKNAAVRAAGLERRRFTFADAAGEGSVAAELTYLHVPAAPGAAAAPPIVLIHPTPHALTTWSELVFGGPGFAGLGGEFEVYALDVIGHGTTRTEAGPYSFQRCADWIAAALDALGLREVVLVGQSYGGEFAWRVAVDRPDLCAKLVLIDSSGLPRGDDEWLPEEVDMREMGLAPYGYVLNSVDRVRTALQPHFRDPVDEDRAREVFLVCESPDNWRAMIDLVRDENGSRAADLARIARPTLVLWGQDDIALGLERHGRRLAAAIPGATLEVLPACGHYPQEERPALVADALRRFVAARR
jgi:pimeloyl-ACP methyl ester carboxylesterase